MRRPAWVVLSFFLSGFLSASPAETRETPLAAANTAFALDLQVGAYTAGVPDNTRLAAWGWTPWVAAGAGWPLGKAASIAAEAYYSPLRVKRPPDYDAQNDGLFNVRALLRFHLH